MTLQLLDRLKKESSLIQVVIGPRQVGKTTAIHQILGEIHLKNHYSAADLPAPPELDWIEAQWNLARNLACGDAPVILVLDEVQKISRWSEAVKKFWDEDKRARRKIRVVILGSSSLLIQKGLTESLAGRFELIRFPHWQFEECVRCFGWNLERYIYFGGYPGSAELIHDEMRWGTYIRDSIIEPAISKDILLLNPVQKPALLRKLFELSCEYGGQILSYQKMLGQLTDAGNTTTLAHYGRLLESAYLIASLEKYSGSRVKVRGSSPKLLPLNTALISAMAQSSYSQLRNNPAAWGRFIECAVGAHLYYYCKEQGLNIFYWRESNFEVDYVVQKGKQIVAFEVKSGDTETRLESLAAFSEKFKSARSIVIGPSGIPLEKFLLEDPLVFLH